LIYVDAVHAVPHRQIDASALGIDVVGCSAYKWFGPHLSMLWARPELLEEMRPDKLRPSPDIVPLRWETGTPSFEAVAGAVAAAGSVLGTGSDGTRAHGAGLMAAMPGGVARTEGGSPSGAGGAGRPPARSTVDGGRPDGAAGG